MASAWNLAAAAELLTAARAMGITAESMDEMLSDLGTALDLAGEHGGARMYKSLKHVSPLPGPTTDMN